MNGLTADIVLESVVTHSVFLPQRLIDHAQAMVAAHTGREPTASEAMVIRMVLRAARIEMADEIYRDAAAAAMKGQAQ